MTGKLLLAAVGVALVSRPVAADPKPDYAALAEKLVSTTANVKEGDTPSFLHLLAPGLSDPEQPTWGGWRGRYQPFDGRTPRFVDARDRHPFTEDAHRDAVGFDRFGLRQIGLALGVEGHDLCGADAVLAAAGHGFGMRDSTRGGVAKWPARLEEWLGDKVLR